MIVNCLLACLSSSFIQIASQLLSAYIHCGCVALVETEPLTSRLSSNGGWYLHSHGAPPAPMKTVLIGGSDDTRSRTSEDDPTRWESNESWELKWEGPPYMQGVDAEDGRGGSVDSTTVM